MRLSFVECQKICEEHKIEITEEIWDPILERLIRKLKKESLLVDSLHRVLPLRGYIQTLVNDRKKLVDIVKYFGELLNIDFIQEIKLLAPSSDSLKAAELLHKIMDTSRQLWDATDLFHADECYETYDYIWDIVVKKDIPFETLCASLLKVLEKFEEKPDTFKALVRELHPDTVIDKFISHPEAPAQDP